MKNSFSQGQAATSWWFGLAVAAGMAAAPTAWAAPINVTAQRSVVVGDLTHGHTFGEYSPYGLTGTFADGAEAYVGGTHPYPGYPDFTTRQKAIAKQASNVDPASGLIAGTGEVGIGFSVVDADLAFARSSIDVWFDLASTHNYALSGQLKANMDGGLGLASVSLQGPTAFVFEKQGWGNDLTLAEAGTLKPGTYHLSIFALIEPQCEPAQCTAYSWMGGTSSFGVGLLVTAVPEPATYGMMLAGLGLLGFVARRRGAGAA